MTTSTAAVSYALRETQRRMLKLTLQVQLAQRSRRATRRLLLSHLSESLATVCFMVGVLFFLGAFFPDQLFALALLSLVWCSELLGLAAAAPRAPVSALFAPRFSAAHLAALCIYCFSFPSGFPYVALAACALSAMSWALFFRNRCVHACQLRPPQVRKIFVSRRESAILAHAGSTRRCSSW